MNNVGGGRPRSLSPHKSEPGSMFTHQEAAQVKVALEGLDLQGVRTHQDFTDKLAGELGKANFGDSPEGLHAHDYFVNMAKAVADGIDFNKPLDDELPKALEALKPHDGGSPGGLIPHKGGPGSLVPHKGGPGSLVSHSSFDPGALRTHGQNKALRIPEYKIEGGRILDLNRETFRGMLKRALENTENIPVAKQWFQLLSLCYFGNTTAYVDPEMYKSISLEQGRRLVLEMPRIVGLLNSPHMDYISATAQIAELTGGILIVVESPPWKTLKKLEDMSRLFLELWDRAEGDTPEVKATYFKDNFIIPFEDIGSSGLGFSARFEHMKGLAFESYENLHPVEREDIKVKDEKDRVIVNYEARTRDNPRYKEGISRELVAWRKNTGNRSANAFLDHCMSTKFPGEDELAEIEAVIREAIVRDFVLDPFEPEAYDSSESPQGILKKEFTVLAFNLSEEDQGSASVVMKYLRMYRGMRKIKATRALDTKPSDIKEKEFHDFIRGEIGKGNLAKPPVYDNGTDINRILEEEFVAYQLDKPKGATKDYDTAQAFKQYLITKRNIFEVKGTERGDSGPRNISVDELNEFVNRQVGYGFLTGQVTFVNLQEAWDDYVTKKKARPDDVAVRIDFAREVKKAGFTFEELDAFFGAIDATPVPGGAVVPPDADIAAVNLQDGWNNYLKFNPEASPYDKDVQAAFIALALAQGITQKELDEFFVSVQESGKDKEK